MVTDRNSEGILDPRIPERPPSRALKKALLVALKCVDPDSQKRPKMGHVIHMLEVDDFPYRDVSVDLPTRHGFFLFKYLCAKTYGQAGVVDLVVLRILRCYF